MDLNATQYVLMGTVIIGINELLTRLRGRDFWVAGTIVMSAVIGGLFGFFGYYPGLDVVQGIAAGFGVAGTLTTVGHIGNKSVATPSPLTK